MLYSPFARRRRVYLNGLGGGTDFYQHVSRFDCRLGDAFGPVPFALDDQLRVEPFKDLRSGVLAAQVAMDVQITLAREFDFDFLHGTRLCRDLERAFDDVDTLHACLFTA
jgi:hypothetical protein